MVVESSPPKVYKVRDLQPSDPLRVLKTFLASHRPSSLVTG